MVREQARVSRSFFLLLFLLFWANKELKVLKTIHLTIKLLDSHCVFYILNGYRMLVTMGGEERVCMCVWVFFRTMLNATLFRKYARQQNYVHRFEKTDTHTHCTGLHVLSVAIIFTQATSTKFFFLFLFFLMHSVVVFLLLFRWI